MKVNRICKTKSIVLNIVGFICLSTCIDAQSQQVVREEEITINSSYLDSKNYFEDYILNTGDVLSIEFKNAPELSDFYKIDQQGEIFFDRLKFTYVRGLTLKELTKLLEQRYKEFLIEPNIYIRIAKFKPVRVDIAGEVRAPGVQKFPSRLSTARQATMSKDEKNIRKMCK